MAIEWTDQERSALDSILGSGPSEDNPFDALGEIVAKRVLAGQVSAWEEGWVAGSDHENHKQLHAETSGEIDTRQPLLNPYIG